ncbi:hypothetical protein N24_0544 [Corynebacterium suranareeae]|uniref:Uncharacterized protein n=1 Tax=Corynebacterium suranareeae TaxID=2506452 RepID=A0A160PN77_9CORY|nr:hypothetical protein N24_0544 [Corynebacterium suranareeae]
MFLKFLGLLVWCIALNAKRGDPTFGFWRFLGLLVWSGRKIIPGPKKSDSLYGRLTHFQT